MALGVTLHPQHLKLIYPPSLVRKMSCSAASSERSATGSCCGADADELNVLYGDCGDVTCKLCGICCTSETPLLSVAERGSIVKWAEYSKVKDSNGKVIGRTIRGRACAICRNVFNALGFEETFATPADFYKVACQPLNAHHMRNFLQMRRVWIARHNANPESGARLRGAKEFKERGRRLLTEHIEQTEFEDGEWDFVLVENWNTKLDGEFDPTKVLEKTIFGKLQKGIYVRRGREGVFKARRKDVTQSRDETVQDDGQGAFSEIAQAAKRETIRKDMQQFEKERCEHHVVQPHLGLEELLGLAQGLSSGTHDAGNAAAGVHAQGAEGADEDDVDATSSDEEVVSAAPSKLRGLFTGGVLAQTAAAKEKTMAAASTTLPKASAKAKAVASGLVTSGKASPGQTKHGSGEAKGVGSMPPQDSPICETEHEVILLDGRTKRIVESMTTVCAQLRKQADDVSFCEDLRVTADKEKKTVLADTWHKKSRALAKLEGDINNARGRINNSSSKAGCTCVNGWSRSRRCGGV